MASKDYEVCDESEFWWWPLSNACVAKMQRSHSSTKPGSIDAEFVAKEPFSFYATGIKSVVCVASS